MMAARRASRAIMAGEPPVSLPAKSLLWAPRRGTVAVAAALSLAAAIASGAAVTGCSGDESATGGPGGTTAGSGGQGAGVAMGGATSTTGVGGGAGGQDGGADAGPPPPTFSFVVFGDNQFATTSCTSGVPERLAVPQVILSLAPTFIGHVGDLMDHGYEAGAYAHLVDCYSGMLAAHPFFPTSGNHDMGSGAIWDYKAYVEEQLTSRNPSVWSGDYASDFAVTYEDDPNSYSTDPGNPGSTSDVPSGFSFKTNYALRYQNLYLLSFEQGTRWWSNTPRSWVHTHLDAARADPTIQHVIVQMHHPLYSTHMEETGSGEAVGPVRGYYEELFRDHDVTLVLNGHVHLYEHFFVPDDGTHTQTASPPTTYPHDGTAIQHVTTGGGGGPTPNGCDPPPSPKQQFSYDYLQKRNCGAHVTQIEVQGKRLHVTVTHVVGSESSHTTDIWDEFTIE